MELKDKLKEIGAVLLYETSNHNEIGVLGGTTGVSLFHFYYAKFLNENSHTDKGVEMIFETFDRIQKGYNYPTFCDGISGALWGLELLKEEQFIELDEDIITPETDEYLLIMMKKDIESNYYDFLHGAIGYGFYFLKRYENSISRISKKRYKEYLDVLVVFFKDTAIKNENGIWWKSRNSLDQNKFEGCNLSLSHGISSIINFLSRLAAHPVFYDDVSNLLKLAVNYLICNKNENTELVSSFSNFIFEGEFIDPFSRLAWCYGDLGIGLTLLRVGEVLNDEELYQEAILILKQTTKRRSFVETTVKDAGICHGAFGIMHIYNHVYKKTKNSVFKKACHFWARTGLDMAIYVDGHAGYKEYYRRDHWKSETSLLGGVAGIGLAIISYLADFDTKWDEALLIG